MITLADIIFNSAPVFRGAEGHAPSAKGDLSLCRFRREEGS